MSEVVIGLDVGSSTTKIIVMSEDKKILHAERVTASGQLTSLFGAVGSLLYDTGMSLKEIACFMTTGVGASFIEGDILGVPTHRVPEIEVMGEGGLFLAGVDKAIVVSIGTGTTLAAASKEDGTVHAGGIALGGGTLTGLASRMFGTRSFSELLELAMAGDTCAVDTSMREISTLQVSSLPDYATACNLGKLGIRSRDEDTAAGLFNMLYQTAGTMAILAARQFETDRIVAVGSLAPLELAKTVLGQVGDLYGYTFIIPGHGAFAAAAGAALRAF